MNYLRDSLKVSFSLTLSLVLLLSLLASVWVAFISIRYIVAPVRDLVNATRAVAAGEYEQRLPVTSQDELGYLMESFNAMTERIARARDEAQDSRLEVENQRAYLETLLGKITSGVLSFDDKLCLRKANQAANEILNVDLNPYLGKQLIAVGADFPNLAEVTETLQLKLQNTSSMWQQELAFLGSNGRRELHCKGTPLLTTDRERSGIVMVFDDVTDLIQAQRNAAWSEVAQRLAHEIKNPLTPIQLSAERMQRKLSAKLRQEEVAVLDRATHTIVQQVEALKKMVDAFSEYARAPKMQIELLHLGDLIKDVLALYQPHSGVDFSLSLEQDTPLVEADPVRMRQVLHNLIKNALEAMKDVSNKEIAIKVRSIKAGGRRYAEFEIRDNGIGIAPEWLDRIFEPYKTSKPKGTGLGLAIVKKIIEEHGGMIWIDTEVTTGCCCKIRLPAADGQQRVSEHNGGAHSKTGRITM